MSRVWDSYLSKRDKAALRERPHQVWGYGERPALLLVDLYRAVFGRHRQPLFEALPNWPSTCGEEAWDAIPPTQRLLAATRAAGLPVIHVTKLSPSRSNVAGWAQRPVAGSAMPAPVPTAEAEGDLWEIMPEVGPLPGEVVLHKSAPSAFFGTLLMSQLSALHCDSILLVGEATGGCVRATCVDARSYRLNVTLVEECVFDSVESSHALNLFDMHSKYADVLGIDEVVAHIESLKR